MRKSIYFRNFFTTAITLLLSFAILGAVFVSWGFQITKNSRRNDMAKTADEVVRSVAALSDTFDISSYEVSMILSMISSSANQHILLVDTDGLVISCSDKEMVCSHLGKEIPDSVLESIDDSGEYSGTTALGTTFDRSRYVVGRAVYAVSRGGKELVCYIFVSTDRAELSQDWTPFVAIFVWVAIFVLIIAFFISFIATRKQAEPINEISVAAHKFARGDYSARVAQTGRGDEIDQLADAFNLMADAIESSENRRREFVANVSHELKTPMTTISGFADGILDGTIPRERENYYLGIISSETHRLSRLVRSMLDMSQITAADSTELLKNTFDIAEVMRVSLLSLEKKITDRDLDVDMELPEEEMQVRGNKDSISQVVYNLIDNAAKFAIRGSTLRLSLWKQGGKAYVAVENTGSTIPESELPFIFDRFHKTDKSRSEDTDGVGLGLYIVKQIVNSHNEDIFVTSRDGVTRFVFTLRLAQ